MVVVMRNTRCPHRYECFDGRDTIWCCHKTTLVCSLEDCPSRHDKIHFLLDDRSSI